MHTKAILYPGFYEEAHLDDCCSFSCPSYVPGRLALLSWITEGVAVVENFVVMYKTEAGEQLQSCRRN
jgi:hypothetical protein